MVWIFLAGLAESRSHLETGSSPLPIANQNRTVKRSFCKECRKGICPRHQYGMTYEPSNQDISRIISTLSTGDSRARISVLQDVEKAWVESEAAFIGRSIAWPKKSSPNSYSLKMYQLSVLGAAGRSSPRLPKSGMIADGQLYPLPRWEPCIDASDGFYWPTPTAQDAKNNAGQSQHKRNSQLLNVMATITASQANKPIRAPSPSRQRGEHGEDIQDSIGRLNPELIGKKLSPMFVEVLMGYRIGWTELKPLGVP